MSLFAIEYPITRPFKFRYFSQSFIVLACLWLAIITLVNIIAVAYDNTPVQSTSYTTSTKLWYEKFTPSFWIPSSWSCDASVIPLSTALATSHEFFQYTLRGYLDPSPDSPIDGMRYEGSPLGNCSVQLLEVSQFLWSPVTDQEWIGCNTSAAQYFVASTSRSGAALPVDATKKFTIPSVGPLNISSVVEWWQLIALGVSQVLVPFGKLSLIHPSLVANQLASLRIAYYDTDPLDLTRTPNTPAGDHWTLYIIYTLQNMTAPTEIMLPIVFLPTGDVDFSRTDQNNFALANIILGPTTEILKDFIGPTFDVWKLLNWIFVSFYWTMLVDLGQIAPTTYYLGGFIEGSPVGVANVSNPPTFFSPTNNIFINETLFEIYYSYITDVLLPPVHFSIPTFSPLNKDNQLQPVPTVFLRTYSCLRREWKGALSGIISVVAADYALFVGAYQIAILAAGVVQKRHQHANHCEGCIHLRSDDMSEDGIEEIEGIGLQRTLTSSTRTPSIKTV